MKTIFMLSLVLIICSGASANSFETSFLSAKIENSSSLSFLYTQNQSPDDTGSSKYANNKNLRLKDTSKAILYAAIPGFVVHGAGHFYAGKTKTGLLLLGTEVLSLAFLVVGALAEFGQSESGGKADVDPGLFFVSGTVLFYGSWLYDLFASPGAVKKRNEELLRNRDAGVELELREDTYYLRLVVKRL
jgi:hypothetical protein